MKLGGTILYAAHRDLEYLCLDKQTTAYKEIVRAKYTELVYSGEWFTPLREALTAFIEKTQETVTGTVKLKLYKGNIISAGVTSPYSLYNSELASFTTGELYSHHDAEGFYKSFWSSFESPRYDETAERRKLMKLWGGRFTKSTDSFTDHFHSSISFDQRMYKQDIRGSIAHADMLGKQGIISKDDAELIKKTLIEILDDIQNGKVDFDEKAEDIHMNVETILIGRIGDVGKRLHTGRSRNDQVALDFKMYSKDEILNIKTLIKDLLIVLNKTAKENIDTIMPGYTHLQNAQPVTLAHHVLAYAEMFKRDYERLSDTFKRTNVMPLGSGALAATTYPLDRESVCEALVLKALLLTAWTA